MLFKCIGHLHTTITSQEISKHVNVIPQQGKPVIYYMLTD